MLLNLNELYQEYSLQIDGIVHIGAHYGREYFDYSALGVPKMIFFEPLISNFEILHRNVPESSDVILVNKALGNDTKKIKMYVETANDGQSSSILEPKVHLTQYPHITFDAIEEVNMIRLDDFFELENIDMHLYNMINIDVQGYELEVLKGSEKFLDGVDYIYTEVNRDVLYKNCVQVEELDSFLGDYGFERVKTIWTGDTWGDAIYIKENF